MFWNQIIFIHLKRGGVSRIRTFWNSFNRIELGTNTSIAKKIGIDHRPPIFICILQALKKWNVTYLTQKKTIVLLSQHNNIILIRSTKTNNIFEICVLHFFLQLCIYMYNVLHQYENHKSCSFYNEKQFFRLKKNPTKSQWLIDIQ